MNMTKYMCRNRSHYIYCPRLPHIVNLVNDFCISRCILRGRCIREMTLSHTVYTKVILLGEEEGRQARSTGCCWNGPCTGGRRSGGDDGRRMRGGFVGPC